MRGVVNGIDVGCRVTGVVFGHHYRATDHVDVSDDFVACQVVAETAERVQHATPRQERVGQIRSKSARSSHTFRRRNEVGVVASARRRTEGRSTQYHAESRKRPSSAHQPGASTAS